MAEGLLRALYGDRYDSFSAGTVATRVNPYVARAMAELGIDLSLHRSKTVDEFTGQQFEYVVTVCDNAKEACPYFAGAKNMIHFTFPDPSAFTGDDESIMNGVRIVRDEIKEWIAETFGGNGDNT
jgi:arsenate reductase